MNADRPARTMVFRLGNTETIAAELNTYARALNQREGQFDAERGRLQEVLDSIVAFTREWNKFAADAADSALIEDIYEPFVGRFHLELRTVWAFLDVTQKSNGLSLPRMSMPETRRSVSAAFEEFLRECLKFTAERANSPGVDARSISELAAATDRWLTRLRDRALAYETEALRDEAQDVVLSIRDAAGSAGAASLSHHFDLRAKRELVAASRFRIATIACFGIVILVAAYWVLFVEPTSVNPARDLLKLAISVPLAGLAFYLARESAHHRQASNWASELAVQLQTLESYIAPLAEEQRNDLRAQFAARVFGQRIVEAEKPIATVPELTDLVTKIATAVRGPA